MMKKMFIFCLLALALTAACAGGEPVERDYTVPSWTRYRRALVAGETAEEARKMLVGKEYPYNIVATINGDPTTRMGLAWFTNAGVDGGTVQLIEGTALGEGDFNGAREIMAASTPVDSIPYLSAPGRGSRPSRLAEVTGFAPGEKRAYTANKVLLNSLTPATTYSYRVGKRGAWSPIGTFTTAAAGKEPFEFIYLTDTQAYTDEMFDTSAVSVEAAVREVPKAGFLLVTGDLVDSANERSAEWEWEQWFGKMQNTWLRLPVAPAQGNHDISPYNNWTNHFNTDDSFNAGQPSDDTRTDMEGTVYSFARGDALFMVLNFEEYHKGEPYFAALEAWMRRQVAAHSDVKWRIVALHKALFTGADHQDDRDGRLVRERFAPVFQELGIDLALQGHDHVYEVIGPIRVDGTTYTRVADAASEQTLSAPTPADGLSNSTDVTGISGGTYQVTDGTLYLLNNSAGKKKYYPRSKELMEAALPIHGVEGFFDLFNRLGQTGEPTFSRVRVATEGIDVETYTVADDGTATLFDAIRVVKSMDTIKDDTKTE
jgi:hypothetical protein